MAFIPILNTVLLSAEFQDTDGILAVNRHYAATISVPTETDLEEVCETYVSYFIENIQTTMTPHWSLTGLVARAMNEEFGIEFVRTADLPVPGASAHASVPNQVSATITWLTGIVGRSFRGRTYLVGLDSSLVDSGQKALTSGGQALLQTTWDGLREAFETAGHALQVVSLFSGGVPRTEGVTTPIVSGRMNFPLATQRRRLR